jgi:hypothetical protein
MWIVEGVFLELELIEDAVEGNVIDSSMGNSISCPHNTQGE